MYGRRDFCASEAQPVFRLQFVQLSAGSMQGSFLEGKKASIGNSIWLKTSQGFSAPEPLTDGQVLVGTQ